MKAYLTVRTGPEAGRRYVLRPGQRFVLGRGQDATIRVEDDLVSRRHAILELDADGLHVTDLDSRNGTWLDEKQLTPHDAKLTCPKDVLRLVETEFDVEVVGLDDKAQDRLERTRRFYRPLLPPDEFDILGEIGRGSTGIVYAAFQRLLLRNVAIKLPRGDVEDSDEAHQRLLREGQLCCRIRSPCVVELHDLRPVGEQVYLIMELVNGISARDRLYGGPIPLGEALTIGQNISSALQAAHVARVVHRDVKPANILLTPEGIAKLSDFGIAKELGETADREALTPSGMGIGTLSYVSPEQAFEARQADPRSDIYSLGATLFHLLGGTPPLRAESAEDLLACFEQPVRSLRAACPSCPTDVIGLIDRMLEREPNARPQEAASLAIHFRRLRRKYEGSGPLRRQADLKQTDEFPR